MIKCSGLGMIRILLRNVDNPIQLRLALGSSTFNSFNRNNPVYPSSQCCFQNVGLFKCGKAFISSSAVRQSAEKKPEGEANEENDDAPIKFTTSRAAQISAQMNLGGDAFPHAPWYQPWVVLFSVGVFLIYFLVLREENDIDEEMKRPLWHRIPGLEKQQLRIVWEYNASHGLDNTEIEERLILLEKEEAELKRKQKTNPLPSKPQ